MPATDDFEEAHAYITALPCCAWGQTVYFITHKHTLEICDTQDRWLVYPDLLLAEMRRRDPKSPNCSCWLAMAFLAAERKTLEWAISNKITD